MTEDQGTFVILLLLVIAGLGLYALFPWLAIYVLWGAAVLLGASVFYWLLVKIGDAWDALAAKMRRRR